MSPKQLIAKLANFFGYAIVRESTLKDILERSRDELGGRAQAVPPSMDFAAYFAADAARPNAAAIPVGDVDNLSAEDHYRKGMAARDAKDDELAFARFARAVSLIPRHEPSMKEMRAMSAETLARARAAAPSADALTLRDLLVRAVEMDPANDAAREWLRRVLAPYGEPDLTKMCFVFYDGERARDVFGEAYRRAIEFVSICGVVGDILEFGVLGGWSARLIAEIMRDVGNFNDIRLFDSFEGLPDYVSPIDRNSYEIGGRNVWPDKMRLPDAFLGQFAVPHEHHIKSRLSEIVRRERIHVHKGFYAQSLKADLPIKASVVHVDCDLYQSAREVLSGLQRMNAFQDGTVLLFDDWNCNRANPNYGERRAFGEFLAGQSRFTASPWFSYGYGGMVYILHDTQA